MGRGYQAEGKSEEAQKLYEESIAYQPTLDSFRALGEIAHPPRPARAGRRHFLPRARAERNLAARALRALQGRRQLLDPRGPRGRSRARVQTSAGYRPLRRRSPLAISACSSSRSGRTAEARRCFQDADRGQPGATRARFPVSAPARSPKATRKSAHDFYARSLELELMNPTAVYQLVKLAYELKIHATAARILGDYVQSAPVNPNLLYSLGRPAVPPRPPGRGGVDVAANPDLRAGAFRRQRITGLDLKYSAPRPYYPREPRANVTEARSPGRRSVMEDRSSD